MRLSVRQGRVYILQFNLSLSSECEVRHAGLCCRVENPQTAAVAALERANNFSGAVDMNKWAAMEGFTDSDEEGNILCSCGKVRLRLVSQALYTAMSALEESALCHLTSC